MLDTFNVTPLGKADFLFPLWCQKQMASWSRGGTLCLLLLSAGVLPGLRVCRSWQVCIVSILLCLEDILSLSHSLSLTLTFFQPPGLITEP